MPSTEDWKQHSTLHSLLLALRKEGGMTQLELAQRIGSPQSQISSWENPPAPDKDQIAKLASVLGTKCQIDIDALLQRMQMLTSTSASPFQYVMGIEAYAEFVRAYSSLRGPFEVYLLGPYLLPVRTHAEIRRLWVDGLNAGCKYHLFWVLDDLDLHEFYTVTQVTFDLVRTMSMDGRGQIHHYATWLHTTVRLGDDEPAREYATRMAAVEADPLVRGRVIMHNPRLLTDANVRRDLGGYWQKLCSLGVHVPRLRTQSPHATVYFSAIKATPDDECRSFFGFLDMSGAGRELQLTVERLARYLGVTRSDSGTTPTAL